MNFTLGVLDQSPVKKGSTAREALQESVELAKFCEQLGYERYWVAEHHNSHSFASSRPEILIGQLAANTKKIKIGSGGVMLPNHSAANIAEQFHTLEAFYPNRIELGIGRGRGTDEFGARVLAYPREIIGLNSFDEQLQDLLEYINKNTSSSHKFSEFIVRPGLPIKTSLDIWLLGSSLQSAEFAAKNGLKFSFAHFFARDIDPSLIPTKIYKEKFTPSCFAKEPLVSVAIESICTTHKDELSFITASRNFEKAASSLNLKKFEGFFPPEEALLYSKRKEIQQNSQKHISRYIDGTFESIKEKISTLATYYDADQILILTNCYSFEDRKKSYQLISQAFDLL